MRRRFLSLNLTAREREREERNDHVVSSEQVCSLILTVSLLMVTQLLSE